MVGRYLANTMKVSLILFGLLIIFNAFSMNFEAPKAKYMKRTLEYDYLYNTMHHERETLSRYIDHDDPFKYLIISQILYLMNKRRLGYTLELVVYFIETVADSNLKNLVVVYDTYNKPVRLTANKTLLNA